MKKLVATMVVISLLMSLFIGCGCDMQYGGKTYVQYGIFNVDDKDPNIVYHICIGNVIWSVILCETIVVPIVLVGFYLYEPVGFK